MQATITDTQLRRRYAETVRDLLLLKYEHGRLQEAHEAMTAQLENTADFLAITSEVSVETALALVQMALDTADRAVQDIEDALAGPGEVGMEAEIDDDLREVFSFIREKRGKFAPEFIVNLFGGVWLSRCLEIPPDAAAALSELAAQTKRITPTEVLTVVHEIEPRNLPGHDWFLDGDEPDEPVERNRYSQPSPGAVYLEDDGYCEECGWDCDGC